MNKSYPTKLLPALLLPLTLLGASCTESKTPTTRPAPPVTSEGDRLAARVMAFSNAQAWPTVSRLKFTFNVEDKGTLVATATHDWNLATNTDTVTWGLPGTEKTVTINLSATQSTEDEKAAFARWTNDSYWLIAPLKLKDAGTRRERLPDAEGNSRRTEVLAVTFDNVGLTPQNEYRWYLDPATARPVAWDYIPDRNAYTPQINRFTWEQYEPAGPLLLSREHRTVDGNRRIFFTNVSVETR